MPRTDEIDRIREKKVLNRIAKMTALGFSNYQISDKINDEFGFKPDPVTVRNVIKQYSVTGTQFLDSEKEIAKLFKESLISLIEESKKNVEILADFRDRLRDILKIIETGQILEGDDSKKFKSYMNEIKEIIRTLDNSLSTQKGILELVDKQKKEVKVSAVQSTQRTLEDLQELEDAGLIVISPKLKEKKKKEEEEEIEL